MTKISQVLVKEVGANSPAQHADLRKGDILISVHGQQIDKLYHIKNMLSTGRGQNFVWNSGEAGLLDTIIERDGKRLRIPIHTIYDPESCTWKTGTLFEEIEFELPESKVEWCQDCGLQPGARYEGRHGIETSLRGIFCTTCAKKKLGTPNDEKTEVTERLGGGFKRFTWNIVKAGTVMAMITGIASAIATIASRTDLVQLYHSIISR